MMGVLTGKEKELEDMYMVAKEENGSI